MLAALMALLRSPLRTAAIAYVGAAGVAVASMVMLFLLMPEGQVVRESLRVPLAPLWSIPQAVIGSVDQTLPAPPLAPASIARVPSPAEAMAAVALDAVAPPSIEPEAFSAINAGTEVPGAEEAAADGEDEASETPDLDVPATMTSDVIAGAETEIEESEVSSSPAADPESASESTLPEASPFGPTPLPTPQPVPSSRRAVASSSLESPSRAPPLPAAPVTSEGRAPLSPAVVAMSDAPQREPEEPPSDVVSVIAASSGEDRMTESSADARGRPRRTGAPGGGASQAEDRGRPCDGGCDAPHGPDSKGPDPDHGPTDGRSDTEVACHSDQSRGTAGAACPHQSVTGANVQADPDHGAHVGRRTLADPQPASSVSPSNGRDDPPHSRGGPSPNDAPSRQPSPSTPVTASRPGSSPENRLENCPAGPATSNANSSRGRSCTGQAAASGAVAPPAPTPRPARPNAGNQPSTRR